jgi:hypothetical protein
MNELRQFRDIETLIEDSVFYPSPRQHLRQRVLQNAIDAKHRQKLWQRFAVVSSAVTGTLLVALVGYRLLTPRPTETKEAGPVRVQIYSPGHSPQPAAEPTTSPTAGTSLGEDMYFHPAHLQSVDSPRTATPADGSGQSNLSHSKEVPTKSD